MTADAFKDLRTWATVRQLEYIEAIEKHGGMRAAARELGVAKNAIDGAMALLKKKAARMGHSPEHGMSHPVPDGYLVKGVSTYYDKEGKPAGQWVKSAIDAERQEALMREWFDSLARGVKGLSPIVAPPATVDSDLLAVYPIGDQHHGMYADPVETGSAYDAKISVTQLEGAFDHLIALSPPAETALMINLGDFLHGNDSTNETEHGNRLDVDTRFGKVLVSGAMALVRCVLKLLQKHKTVHVWNVRGNHDRDAALALAMGMSFYFHNEPRVIVDMGTSLYKYHRFGEVLIGSHHGHGAKPQDLPLIMADDRKEDWGKTSHRVWHCGHIHHLTRRDFTGCTVETHRTLAGTDAWHAGQGYRSKKDMNAIVYHRRFGEIQRTRFEPMMLGAQSRSCDTV